MGAEIECHGISRKIIQLENLGAIKEHIKTGPMPYVRFRLARGLSEFLNHGRRRVHERIIVPGFK